MPVESPRNTDLSLSVALQHVLRGWERVNTAKQRMLYFLAVNGSLTQSIVGDISTVLNLDNKTTEMWILVLRELQHFDSIGHMAQVVLDVDVTAMLSGACVLTTLNLSPR